MKKITAILFLCHVVMASYAQSFEGIIRWSFKTEITDPATKAKMEAAQKQMSDPANQAKMKEMQAKMNDPQFKQMMEANPQLKAQMEAAMKMSESGDMNAMMPKSFEVRVKNMNAVSKIEGGIMDKMEILYLKDKNVSYRIDRQGKTYSVLPSSDAVAKDDHTDIKVTKTSETTKILNYTCTKYIVESSSRGEKTEHVIWATNEIKDFDMKKFAGGAKEQSKYFEKIDGVPLKMELKMPQGNMTMQAIEIKKQAMPASDFVVPAGYKEVKMGY